MEIAEIALEREEIARRQDEASRLRMAKMQPRFPPKVPLTEEEEVEERRLTCLRALERRGLAPPGPRPLFNMFATEEHLALLGSKVRAKMGHTRQASSGKLEVGQLSRGASRGSARQLLV